MPTHTKADTIMAAAQNLMKVLTQEATSNIIHQYREKLIELATIFQNVVQKLPQDETEKESATIISNKEQPKVENACKQIQPTTQQPHQTHAQNDMITTTDALTVNGTPKIVWCPNNHQQPHIISQEEAEEEESPPHENTSPAANTHSQTATCTITQECILSSVNH